MGLFPIIRINADQQFNNESESLINYIEISQKYDLVLSNINV